MKTRRSGIEIELAVEPVFPLLHNVGTALLAGVGGLFSRDGVAHEEALDRAETEDEALRGQIAPDLFDGRVPVRPQRRDHDGVVRLDALRPPVPTRRLRSRIAQLTLAALTL